MSKKIQIGSFRAILVTFLGPIRGTLYSKINFFLRNHFLFSEQSILMGRKGGDSNNPKRFWHILLLRPDVGDFKTWIFWTS